MKEIHVQLNQVSDCSSEAALRGHRVRIDRPLDKGGSDSGPMGGELFLAAVGGCFMSNLLAAIKARNVEISRVEIHVTGSVAESPDRFAAVELVVKGVGASPEAFDHVVQIADRGCIMMNTLRDKLEVRIRATLDR